MATYVLVHGSWLGGWCWEKVVPRLTEAGHHVLTPTLRGLGHLQHFEGNSINLDLHIQDIVNLFEKDDMHSVILVGHSYAGMVITAVADRCSEQIAHLVYVDALIPENGKAIVDLIPPQMAQSIRDDALSNTDTTRFPPASPEILGITKPEDVAWVTSKSVDMPIATHEQPLFLSGAHEKIKFRTYISCIEPALGGLTAAATTACDNPEWQYFELATGHDPMITMPRELSEILLRCSQK